MKKIIKHIMIPAMVAVIFFAIAALPVEVLGCRNRGLLAALVAIVNKKIIEFVSVHDVGFRAYLGEMAIAEKYQKSGIGSLLLKKAETILANKGCKLIVADVYPPAEDFYRKNGWVKPNAILLAKRIKIDKG